jgi:membrane-associated phospholipid phosphatase
MVRPAGPARGGGSRPIGPGGGPDLRRHRRGRSARGLSAVAIAAVAVAAVVVAGTARRHGNLARPDTAISRWSLAHQTPGWSRFMHDASYLGEISLMVPVLVVLVGLAAAAGWPRPAAFIGLSAGSAIGVTWILKTLLGTSPPGGDPLVLDGPGAFPSGHTAVATAVFGALAVVAATARWPAAVRWPAVAALVVLVVVVGLSRIYDRAHWPSDVGAGWLLAGAWVLAAAVAVGPRWLAGRPDP